MVEFNFYLSDEDTDRLFALKQQAGKDDLTGNEYAKELLHQLLYKRHPQTVEYDEQGAIINESN